MFSCASYKFYYVPSFKLKLFFSCTSYEFKKDIIADDLKIRLGHHHRVTYEVQIDDINKLNLRRYQCQMPTTDFEATQHRHGLKTKCLAKCIDKYYYRDSCNCTTLNAFYPGSPFPDCSFHIFPNLPSKGVGYIIQNFLCTVLKQSTYMYFNLYIF